MEVEFILYVIHEPAALNSRCNDDEVGEYCGIVYLIRFCLLCHNSSHAQLILSHSQSS